MTLSPAEHQTLRMPELPKPPTMRGVIADFVTGRLRKRISSLERRLAVLIDKVNDHAGTQDEDYQKLEAYITKVARASARDRAESERRHADMLSTLANVLASTAANTNGQRRPIPPPHPSLAKTVEYGVRDDEVTTVMGAR